MLAAFVAHLMPLAWQWVEGLPLDLLPGVVVGRCWPEGRV
jgi:hypothetical protein